MKNIARLLFTVVLFTTAASSYAGSFACGGKVANILVYRDGSVTARFHWGRLNGGVFQTVQTTRFMPICNTKKEWKNVSILTCSLWVADLSNAKIHDKLVRVYYVDNDSASCTEFSADPHATSRPASATPSPIYIGL